MYHKKKSMNKFKVSKDINITGLLNKSTISVPYYVLENAFGEPTIIEDNNYAIWKLKFEDVNESIAILNDNGNYLETTKWIVKARNLRSLNRIKNILASI